MLLQLMLWKNYRRHFKPSGTHKIYCGKCICGARGRLDAVNAKMMYLQFKTTIFPTKQRNSAVQMRIAYVLNSDIDSEFVLVSFR